MTGDVEMRITSEIAHSILLKLKKLVDYNINIMNEEGLIVGSTDSTRLYQIHQGALEVYETKEAIYIYSEDEKQYPGAKQGVNLPIEIQQKIIGCIGVTGEPGDVIQFVKILKVTVEVMLQEMELFNKLQYENKIMENWVRDFVHPQGVDFARLEEEGIHYLNLDFNKNLSIILIQFEDLLNENDQNIEVVLAKKKRRDDRLKLLKSLLPEIAFSAFIEEDCCLIAVPYEGINHLQISRIVQSCFLAQSIETRIGIGNSYEGISGYRKSFLEALDSLLLLAKFPKAEKIAHITEWGLVYLFKQIPQEKLKIFYFQNLPYDTSLNEEQIHTLEALYGNGLNMKETAKSLHIHRNTLLYRLDGIAKKTRLDPKVFHDALMLKVLMVIEKLAL